VGESISICTDADCSRPSPHRHPSRSPGAGGENGSYEFDAEPASVPSSAASEAGGYEGEEPKPFTIEQEFDVAGVNAQVSATTWAAGYENSENGSALFVASTPNASVGGQSVNPLVRAGRRRADPTAVRAGGSARDRR